MKRSGAVNGVPGGPAEGFQGKAGKTLRESKPWWASQGLPPAGAPNVVIILLDDLGFSDFGCFGSEIETPNIDALAAGGLRFMQYTTVPMCTPARAALMTGKNPHSVGAGWLTHSNPGYPGYHAGEISKDAPTIPELLRANGYSTYAVGKWHNTADYNVLPSGNRDSWPLQRGFDRFYGILAAETNYFSPGEVFEDNSLVELDDYPAGYYSSDDWTNKAISWLKAHVSATPAKPFFLYVAHNAPHVPFHVKPDDAAKYRGAYDAGWTAIRGERFRRQGDLGVIPKDWKLSEPGPPITAWAAVAPEQRKIFARYMELYAGIVDNIDQNLGRLTSFLRDIGALENTLLILTSDNGATAIGGPEGASNILSKRVTRTEDPGLASRMMARGELGGMDSYPAYPVAWGNVSNTPFRQYKRTPMNGGIRVPFIAHWPAAITDGGAIRREWIHVSDTLPTLLELIGARYPDVFNGFATRGLDGVSYRGMLLDANAKSGRDRQHFELEGNRGYILDRWKIVSLQPPGNQIDLNNWMLFDLERDPTETQNLAAEMPEKLTELVQAFEADADANYIYPLDNRDIRRVLSVPPFLEGAAWEAKTFYPGANTAAMATVSPLVSDRDFTLECRFTHDGADEGVIFAAGDSNLGFAVFVRAGKACFVYNGGEEPTVRDFAIDVGEIHLILKHRTLGNRQGVGTISVNGRQALGDARMSPTIVSVLAGVGMDVGLDRRQKVSPLYRDLGSFPYTGSIAYVRIEPGQYAAGSYANRPEAQAQLD